MKPILFFLLVLSAVSLGGCFQVTSEEDELRTVPITNNPQLIPGSSGGLPGMPMGAQPPGGPR